ncbi:GNAT family N-acetyltransferase [Nesterenkonia sp. HG001]|uniref:GNAT family N-acetyltransferase n=1 Tax=Nesterenkonia sp. HG001 TaxID=2983207 RepID=UPI002AC5D880|nr:GNAT family N-acetyltransferase [Nesterenkonia sp. HG001]MDZ5076666.1 GNAT family N-acetyltransferase [Nesterenkonia sp. HG001]
MAWRIEPLSAAHRDRLLRFEERNREYFAHFIPDRGDAFFEEFDQRMQALLDAQSAGTDLLHVIVTHAPETPEPAREPTACAEEIIGRINLIDVDAGQATLGYRVAESVSGRGVATWAVAKICELAVRSYGLRVITADVSHENPASRRVLESNGFQEAGATSWEGGSGVRMRRCL